MPCGILVPPPEIESMPLALKARSLNHWTAREVHGLFFFLVLFFGEHSSFCTPGFNSFLQSYRSVADLQCCVNFYCRAKGFSDTYIYTFFFIFFSIMVYHRVLNIVPPAVQEDLVAHPFYIQ